MFRGRVENDVATVGDVTINRGQLLTRNADVELVVTPPAGTTQIEVSNDGGATWAVAEDSLWSPGQWERRSFDLPSLVRPSGRRTGRDA